MHTHFLPIAWPDYSAKYGDASGPWPWMRPNEGGDPSKAMLMLGEEEFRPVHHACWDIPKRLDDMDRDAIDHQILSSTPILFQWHRPAEESADVARYFNDLALELCEQGNGRLSTLCQVPLQDLDTACTEVSRAFRSGHKGVQIGNHHGPQDMDSENLVAFLAHCASEGIPVMIHPWDMLNPEGRLDKYMMQWTVGMPAETQLSIVSMILGGSFDKLDPKLDLVFAHGGGSFPYLLGRLENAYIYRDIARGVAKKPPSGYLDRFHTDSAVFDHRSLRCLVDVMGTDRIMLGSDYPFPLGEQRIGSLIRTADFLTDQEKAAMLGLNAAAFFRIPIPDAARLTA